MTKDPLSCDCGNFGEDAVDIDSAILYYCFPLYILIASSALKAEHEVDADA